jgi:hypothetical protein
MPEKLPYKSSSELVQLINNPIDEKIQPNIYRIIFFIIECFENNSCLSF